MRGEIIKSEYGPKTIRILGAILMIIGVMLSSGMASLMLWANNMAGKSVFGIRFIGGSNQKSIVLMLFGVVAFFGFTAFIGGLFQFITGKRSRIFVWFMYLVWFVIVGIAYAMDVIF